MVDYSNKTRNELTRKIYPIIEEFQKRNYSITMINKILLDSVIEVRTNNKR